MRRERIPVEPDALGERSAEFLGVQSLTARQGFPADAHRRIARLIGAQTGEILAVLHDAGMAFTFRVRAGCCLPRRCFGWFWIDQTARRQRQAPRPGARDAERINTGERQRRTVEPTALPRWYAQYHTARVVCRHIERRQCGRRRLDSQRVTRAAVVVQTNPQRRRLAGKDRIATGRGDAQLEQVALRVQQRHHRHAGKQKGEQVGEGVVVVDGGQRQRHQYQHEQQAVAGRQNVDLARAEHGLRALRHQGMGTD